MAALGNHCETLQQLISAVADINAVNDEGRSVIMCAASRGNCAAIELLLDSGEVDLTLSDQNGDTILHLACKSVSSGSTSRCMMVEQNDAFNSDDRQHSEIPEIVSPILTSVLLNNDLAYVMKLAMIGSQKRKDSIVHMV